MELKHQESKKKIKLEFRNRITNLCTDSHIYWDNIQIRDSIKCNHDEKNDIIYNIKESESSGMYIRLKREERKIKIKSRPLFKAHTS